MLRGPRGGSLSARGTGALLDFVENGPGEERHRYGRFAFTISDSNYASSHDGQKAIVGTRSLETSRYGLARADKTGIRRLHVTGSLPNIRFYDRQIGRASGMARLGIYMTIS